MSSKSDVTRNKILETAKNHFLKDGLDGSSLRNIVKDAGLTTGAFYKYFPTKESLYDALIDPYLNNIYQIYDDILSDFKNFSANEQTNHMNEYSNQGIERIVDYVYDNYDNFRLLLKCGDSGKYTQFIHCMVDKEVASTIDYINCMKNAGIIFKSIDKSLIHMITTGFFSALFQIIEHDIDKEVAKKNIAKLKEFQTGGWEKLFKIVF